MFNQYGEELNPITHDTLIFNLDDVVLLLSAGQYLLLAGLLFVTRGAGERAGMLLAAFLLLKVVQALDTLFIWSAPLRQWLLQQDPDLIFIGTFSYWLQGPVLFWYVSRELYEKTRFKRWDLAHLVPTLLAVVLMSNYYLLPEQQQIAAMQNMQYMWSPLMTWLRSGWYISFIAYSSWCIVILVGYRSALRQRFANTETRERRWLLGIVIALTLITCWELLVHLIGNSLPFEIANLLGVAGNYTEFIFVNVLVFTSIRFNHLFSGLDRSDHAADRSRDYTQEQVARVEHFMEEHKPYLEADISIEGLARRLSLPERTLSRILNQHFGLNFFEFINRYRTETAKQLLRDPNKTDMPIIDVMNEAGFTSKSTFNAIFKKQVGKTPSQYRTGK